MAGAKLHIPRLGDKIVLAEPWTFTLWNESRNQPLKDWLGLPTDWESLKPLLTNADSWWASRFTKPVTLPAGTELTIRRLYMRQSARDFDSITFTAMLLPRTPPALGKVAKPKAVRFWSKLDEVNTMQVWHAGGVASAPQVEVWGKETGPELHVPLSRQYINQEVDKGMANMKAAFSSPAAAWPFPTTRLDAP